MDKPEGFFSDEEIRSCNPRLLANEELIEAYWQRRRAEKKRLERTKVTRSGLLFDETKSLAEWQELDKRRDRSLEESRRRRKLKKRLGKHS